MISNEELDFIIKQARKKLRAECKLSDAAVYYGKRPPDECRGQQCAGCYGRQYRSVCQCLSGMDCEIECNISYSSQ